MDGRSAKKRQEREKNTAEKRGDREHMIELTDYSIWEIRRQIRTVTFVCAFIYHPKNSLISLIYFLFFIIYDLGSRQWDVLLDDYGGSGNNLITFLNTQNNF